jgi:hypothetical protein
VERLQRRVTSRHVDTVVSDPLRELVKLELKVALEDVHPLRVAHTALAWQYDSDETDFRRVAVANVADTRRGSDPLGPRSVARHRHR